jgi:hypothetical protein
MNAPALIPIARLPQTYEAARQALSECSEVDECKDWADKAAALASYAKQAEDDQLERMAQRIRARAIRRAGELLKQIEPQQGQRRDLQPSVGVHTKSREDAAREAGMSKHQQVQAVRVANVPADDFERQVESPKPPTLSELASQGVRPRQPVDLGGRDPRMFNRALHFTALVTEYAADLAKAGATELLPHLDDGQRLKLRNALRQIDGIHDQIATRI